MVLPPYHSPEVSLYADTVALTIDKRRVQLTSVLRDLPVGAFAIAAELAELTGMWNPVELYTADNFEAEREKFLAAFRQGSDYQPVFRYGAAERFDAASARVLLEILRKRANALPKRSNRDRLVRATLLGKIDDDLATCDIAQGIATKDDALVKRGCEAKYPGGDPSLMVFAKQTFERGLTHANEPHAVRGELNDADKQYLSTLRVSPREQADAFAWALKQYGIFREDDDAKGDGFRVVLDARATALDVRDKSAMGPVVVVPTMRDGSMTAKELCALVAHEIEGHARQAVNGMRLFKAAGGALRTDDETLYEGLATRYEWDFMEKHFGEIRHDMYLSTLYVFAVDVAENGGSFADVFVDQVQRRMRVALKLSAESPLPEASSVDPDAYDMCLQKAWRTTYRVMRGHTDTSNAKAFAMSKDLAYLRGWLMDRELLKNNLGHANEAAIMSAAGLQALGRVAIGPDDLPLKFKDVAPQYMRMLLAKRGA